MNPIATDRSCFYMAMVGPESSGKTTLAIDVAKGLDAPWVPEYARAYFETHAHDAYDVHDIIRIAQGQAQARVATLATHPQASIVVSDTDALVCLIWAQRRFCVQPKILLDAWLQDLPDLTVLVEPDIPWVFDPLRESEHDRSAIFEDYARMLRAYAVPHVVVQGSREERVAMVMDAYHHCFTKEQRL